ncbi:MAG TPA: 3-oxoacyl-ACP synthase [Cyclobacteriaceae bacterium]|nr:GreA/GreB family elongation factor [Cyclobacteriaceae bacterium]HMV09541.1 3-oxoacyl-ACP synthase [Cyclobacteriaceae bacterium]HMV91689.1 3-oxoacyl-ACP synthase [Cyclobacteriaceae bacterium]HMX01996.1 3-oxoacyl-ACP synthase [Cyclobacteriaceae bacterium]HMX51865.1 3-oxoacyl-ACP synthase [Cyclobacteriaceae bacterium]
MADLKQKLYEACARHLHDRITELTASLRSIQESANEETKSSSGDKYETGRAMAHLEIEKLQTQLAEANKMMADLNRISIKENSAAIKAGSLVFTSRGNFFIAIHAGEHTLDGTHFFVVSPASPIAQKMLGLKAGDEFTLNNRAFSIVQTL